MWRAFRGSEKGTKNDVRLQRNNQLIASMKLEGHQLYDHDKIQLGDLIGTGGFAKVYHCNLEGKPAVCKAINVEKIDDEATYLLTNECTIWSKLTHPNIVGFFGMSTTPTAILLLCEYMRDGSLLELHERYRKAKRPPPAEMDLIQHLSQVASGMEYLHSFEPPVLHRDLKSANILLAPSESEELPRLAIADFGLARYQEDQKKMTAETGSYRWMAPEVIRHEKYNWRCDVYSYGVLAWEMLTYRLPFENMMPVEAAFAVAKEAKRPPVPDSCPASVSHMVQQCWQQDARNRPSFKRICAALREEAALVGVPSGSSACAVAAEPEVGAPASDLHRD